MTTPSNKSAAQKIIVALDFDNAAIATAMAKNLSGTGVKFKVGMELFYVAGPSILDKIRQHGEIFLDLKLHDIPETMAKAAMVLANTGVWMMNVHASAGRAALARVAETVASQAAKSGNPKPLLIAVTVLTSLADLSHMGVTSDAMTTALKLAKLTRDAGLDGVVCSPKEVSAIKTLGPNFLCVTPGIRSPGDNAGDQIRTATPKEALQNGSDYLVIGRPITKAADPKMALDGIVRSLA